MQHNYNINNIKLREGKTISPSATNYRRITFIKQQTMRQVQSISFSLPVVSLMMQLRSNQSAKNTISKLTVTNLTQIHI